MDRPLPLPFTAPVKGVSFRQEEVVLLKEGTHVRVVHEPDNEYDANACAVYGPGGGKLGFIPAAIAGRLAARGEGMWRGVITEVRRGERWGCSVIVEKPFDAPKEKAVEVESETGPKEQDEPVIVTSRSGRVLGQLVKRAGGKVLVRNASGVEIPYPEELVKVQ